jgi:hypothetical protein
MGMMDMGFTIEELILLMEVLERDMAGWSCEAKSSDIYKNLDMLHRKVCDEYDNLVLWQV